MASKGQQPAGQTTNTQAPLPYMYPYIGQGLQSAGDLYSQGGPQVYSGQRVAGFNDPQQQAMAGTLNLGLGGTPGMNAAGNFDANLINNPQNNPFLGQQFQLAAQATQPQLASEFAGAGRDITQSLPLRQQQLNNLATGLYGSQYENNIQNALQAGNQAQNLFGTQLAGLGAAQGVGQQIQDLAQRQIGANMDYFNQSQMQPYNALQLFQQGVNAFSPGQAQSSPYFTNPGANLLGTALAGQQLYNGYQNKGDYNTNQLGNLTALNSAPNINFTPMATG